MVVLVFQEILNGITLEKLYVIYCLKLSFVGGVDMGHG
jgi:hypothetical protein